MFRFFRALVALALAGGLVAGGVAMAGQATPPAKQPPAQTTAQQPPATPSKWIPPIKGQADVQVIMGGTKVDFKTNTVVTTMKVKNVSTAPIAGLTVEEFWWDSANNPVAGGDRQRVKKLLQPGEVVEITLTTQKDKGMARNTYQFRHANGTIKVKTVKVF